MLSAPPGADRGFSLPRLTSPQALRVAHVVPNLRGTATTQVRRLCERLLEYNANVTLVSVFPSELDPYDRARLPVRLVELRQTRGAMGRIQALAAELKRLEPDIAHFHFDLGRFVGRLAANVVGQIPFVVLSDDAGGRGGALRSFGDQFLGLWTSAFVVPTEQSAAALKKRGVPKKKITVIPSGSLDVAANAQTAQAMRRELGIGENELAYFLPAPFAAQKNQRLAMRALSRIYGDRENWCLCLLGEGPDDTMLRRETGRLQIATRVRYLNPKLEMAKVLPAMDVFVMSSNWERQPTAMTDAMLVGMPIVSTPWEGYDEYLVDGETGFVAGDWSQEALADAIDRMLRDPERTKQVANRSRMLAAERYDMDIAARKHAELYYNLVRRGRS